MYASSDVFVLPNRAETFGSAAVEAAASGLPVIASMSAVWANFLSTMKRSSPWPPGDRHALAAAIQQFLERPKLAIGMGHA